MIEADTTWLTENFEPMREEVWLDVSQGFMTCLRCAGCVPRYGAAWHLRWHEELLGDGLAPARQS